MPKDNLSKQPKEEILADALKTIFSEDGFLQISEICIKNEIGEEKIEEIAHQIGLVLLGKLPPKQLRTALEKEAKLDPLTATKINQEINQTIFAPVKSFLEEVYKMEIVPPTEPKVAPSEEEPKTPEEKPEVPPKKDVYREPIE
ncbi:MAG: hypothetical protein COW72_02175 [Candidatus Nealsonbacteria bacterium CG18_big_fil_WC_8_21_14_2_50_37_10]|uniref:Uncharacterized protein n=1 Tax=Candidatus Nealsonbacteria bacterium CG18_big_fil_WC_8_21_14_2_50_37_10 TaxID=1974717 RepID=A0A2H0FJY2_9BACT|nr:MAG: hypothetical protein COW72_02175 [Candidatus Nealsonbacteria bacterium CG18_big_fil_WC_8_21_14_2_50_37_10]